MKLFLSSASFSASYGGPAYSVQALGEALALRGVNVAIWAPDGSAQDQQADIHGVVSRGGVTRLAGALPQVVRIFGEPDLFHDSGLWWRHNREVARLARRLSKPLVVSTRGMLEPAAMQHRAWKKKVGWLLYQKRILNGAAALHVTSELEAKNVRAFGLRPDIVTISNGLAIPPQCPVRKNRPKKVLFLGRLHPIKGLPMLIEAWARIRVADWTLDIVGPDEVGHRQSLEAQVKALAIEGSVHFKGAVAGDEKRHLLSQASLFVLPSLSENFGVAAGEALAAGLPVIATKGTPWAALEFERCGWHVCTSVDGLESGLRAAFDTSLEELDAMGRRGHAFVARSFSWDRVAEDMLQLYGRI